MHEYLKNIRYRALLNSDIVDSIGNSLYDIVFIIYASTVPNKKLAVSLASMATLVPALLSVIIGAFADKTHKKVSFIIFTRTFQAILFIFLAIIINSYKTFGIFLVLLFINIISDILGNYGNGLSLPLLQHTVPEKGLDSAMGLYMASNTSIQLIFQAIGATLIVIFNYQYSIFGLINAGTFCIAGLIILFHKKLLKDIEFKLTVQNSKKTKARDAMKSAFNFLLKNKKLLTIVVFAVSINFIGASMIPLINVSLLKYKSLYLFNYGNTVAILNIVFSLGTILGSLFIKDFLVRYSINRLLTFCACSMALLSLSLVWHKSLPLVMLFLLTAGYMAGKINPRISALILKVVPDTQIASTNGLFQMLVLIGAPLGQVLLLGVANSASPLYSWLLFFILSVIITVATFFIKAR